MLSLVKYGSQWKQKGPYEILGVTACRVKEQTAVAKAEHLKADEVENAPPGLILHHA